MPYFTLFALLFFGSNFIVVPGNAALPDKVKPQGNVPANFKEHLEDLEREQGQHQERIDKLRDKVEPKEPDNLLQELKSKAATEIFKIANSNFHEGNYEQAIETYRVLNTLYPFSEYAEQTKLFSIQALYNSGKMNEVVTAVEKFLMLYPASEYCELAAYLKIKAYFYHQDSILGWLHWVSDGTLVDFAERKDHEQLQHLESAFSKFLEAFPDGKYYEKAKKKLKIIQTLCIKREWNIATFYSKRSNYRASYNRLNNVLQKYPKVFEILSSEQAGELQQMYQTVQKRLELNASNAD